MIAQEIGRITAALPAGVRLVAVSKYHPSDAIREAYAAGQRLFGESHAQELQQKHTELADLEGAASAVAGGGADGRGAHQGVEWHFIGHLQTNKVKYIAPYVHLIHAADSPHLLAEIDRQGGRVGRRIPCLLQLHVAAEETKFGFLPDEARRYLEEGGWRCLQNVHLSGVMCMASNTDNVARIRDDFRRARRFFEEARRDFFHDDDGFRELSMGMSDDWQIAVDEGSTLVRIGTQIFGARQY